MNYTEYKIAKNYLDDIAMARYVVAALKNSGFRLLLWGLCNGTICRGSSGKLGFRPLLQGRYNGTVYRGGSKNLQTLCLCYGDFGSLAHRFHPDNLIYPIYDSQPRHLSKVAYITRHQCGPMAQGNTRYQQISSTNFAQSFDVSQAIKVCCSV